MKKLTVVLVVLIILSVLTQLIQPSANLSKAYFDTGAPPNIVRIKDPTYCLPAMLTKNSTLDILLEYSGQEVQVLNVVLYGIGREYEVSNMTVIPGSGLATVEIGLPPDIESGLYTILAKVLLNGTEYDVVSPRSLWVVDEYPASLKILHLSDIHIGISMDNWWASDRYERYVALANHIEPDIIIITGDIADVGSDVYSYRDFMKITNKFLRPTFCIPGNHDWSQVGSLSSFYKLYGTFVGPRYWVRELGNFVLVGLDTGYGGVLDTEQLTWLNSTLSTYNTSEKKILILMHHPLFTGFGALSGNSLNYQPLLSYMYSSWRDNLGVALTFLQIIDRYPNVVGVFSGHIHRDSTLLYSYRTWFLTATTADGGTSQYRGYRLYQVYVNGTVKPINYGTGTYAENASYPADGFNLRVITDANLTLYANLISATSPLPLTTDNFTLYFFLNKTLGISSYKLYAIYNTTNISYEYMPYGDLWLIKSSVPLKPNTKLYLIFSSYPDEAPPSVQITYYTPTKPISGKSVVTVYIAASDSGWGLDTIKLLYKKPGDPDWSEASVQESQGTYIAQIPPLTTNQVIIKAVATDIAGHVGETPEVTISYTGVTTTTTTTPTTSPTTTPTTAPTTTTTPTTTPITTLTTPTTTQTTPTTPYTSLTTQTTTPLTRPPQGIGLPMEVLVVIAIVVVILVIVVMIGRRKI